MTAVVEWSAEIVTWRDFGYQTDYEPFDPAETVDEVGPFVFDRIEYNAVLQRFRDRFDTERSELATEPSVISSPRRADG